MRKPRPARCGNRSRLELRLGRRFVNRETKHLVEIVELLPGERAVLRNLTVRCMMLPYSKYEISEGFKPVR